MNMYLFLNVIFVLLALFGSYYLRKKFESGLMSTYQGIVNAFNTPMNNSELKKILSQQFMYFLKNNPKIPFLIKYVHVIFYIIVVVFWVFNIVKMNFMTVFSLFFMSSSLGNLARDLFISLRFNTEEITLFWEEYLERNGNNELRVVVNFTWNPNLKYQILAHFYSTIMFFYFSFLTTLIPF